MQKKLRQSDRLSIFAKVAQSLGLEASFVQQVAAGEIECHEVDAALQHELDEVTHHLLRLRTEQVAPIAPTGERRQFSTTSPRLPFGN